MLKRCVMGKRLWLVALSLLVAGCGGGNDVLGPIREDMTSGIGINGYLWRASLDTLAPLPIAEADPTGGVILTDWYINPDAPGERLKVSVFIVDRGLRADALRVSVVREQLVNGIWQAAPVRAGTALQIEDDILVRARELRIATIEND